MPVEVEEAIAALTRLQNRLDDETRAIVKDGADLIQLNARAATPIGTPGNTTNAPGELRESIVTTPVAGGGGRWVARVLTDLVYSWQREAGGELHGAMAFNWGKYPNGRWGTITHLSDGRVLVWHVTQVGAFYMEKGRDRSVNGIRRIAINRVNAAIRTF